LKNEEAIARVETQCHKKNLTATGPTVIESTGNFSSSALSVQTAVKKSTCKMTNNVYRNRKVYFPESDNCVSNKKLNLKKCVKELCRIK
jgi:hypothetical protein